jgi:hypothetical protein
VGEGGVIYRSTDSGANWLSVTSPTSEDLLDVGANGRFVAVGAGGTIVRGTSTGASGTWEVVPSPVVTDLRFILYDSSRFLAVGDSEVVMRSFDGTAWIQTSIESSTWTGLKGLYRGTKPR